MRGANGCGSLTTEPLSHPGLGAVGFYGKAKKTGSRLIRKYGVKITIQRTEPCQFNPATGRTEELGTTTEWQPHAIKTDISITPMTDTRIKAGDAMLLVDIVGHPVPARGDIAIIKGQRWSIALEMPVEPGDELVVCKCAIRRV